VADAIGLISAPRQENGQDGPGQQAPISITISTVGTLNILCRQKGLRPEQCPISCQRSGNGKQILDAHPKLQGHPSIHGYIPGPGAGFDLRQVGL
jgi:hypothetical protein